MAGEATDADSILISIYPTPLPTDLIIHMLAIMASIKANYKFSCLIKKWDISKVTS